ncbi:acyltransferase [Bacillus sp. OTU2372]|uniref:acyltransferase n=1 Tax=Bacillus sp. OTU2372 TaxID=3043858 RepID=UPI00313BEF0A
MIKDKIKKLLFGPKASSDLYIDYLRKIGVQIGKDCIIYSPRHSLIDIQYPWMLEIGNNVKITHGVIILTHDYSWSVLKKLKVPKGEGAILGASGKVSIGDNVFIGMNATILRGVTIGNNVVIGAGSVVSKNCPSNGVYAGNPARLIMSIEDFYIKREEKQLEEAKSLALEYYKKFQMVPEKEVFHEYFMLFENTPEKLCSVFEEKLMQTGNYKDSKAFLSSRKAQFSDYHEFLRFCGFDIKQIK